MKRPSSAQGLRKKKPTPAQIRRHIAKLVDAYQIEWHCELVSSAEPDWSRLLCLHLQMVELEGTEAGMGELF
jgi:hypothetical protein